MSTDPELGQWLADRHAAMTTSGQAIAAAIRQAAGPVPITARRRIVIGQMNEVYDVTMADGRELILRISHAPDPRFEAERWALDAARRAGAPTPRVLLVTRIEEAGGERAACIQEKLPGTPLDQVLRRGSLDTAGISPAGIAAVLAAIHSVPVDGFGYLQPDGRGWDVTFADIMVDLITRAPELRAAAAHWQLDPRLVERGLAALAANRDLYDFGQARLTHGDFSPEHLLVADGAVTGVLDFQECSGNHPVLDFAHWHVASAELAHPVPVGLLRAAYPGDLADAESFDLLLRLAVLRWCLWMLLVRIGHQLPVGVADVVPELRAALDFLARQGAGG